MPSGAVQILTLDRPVHRTLAQTGDISRNLRAPSNIRPLEPRPRFFLGLGERKFGNVWHIADVYGRLVQCRRPRWLYPVLAVDRLPSSGRASLTSTPFHFGDVER